VLALPEDTAEAKRGEGMKGLTEVERVRYDIGLSIAWLTKAQGSLDWPSGVIAAAGQAKAELQAALPLVREAITDLDGLIQDQKNEADGIDPDYE
jgi:hypothetical protein